MAIRNVAAKVADLLATSPDDRVFRATLRSQLPEGKVRPGRAQALRNNVSEKSRDALREFERAGWIVRDEEAVVILNRMALYEFANR